ncbi:YSIRK-type signal peptide-containing protein [Staphylococcus simulans]|nr:YSIRK-type signal peptide-containing protein [Staphylococcus simulans]MDT4011153.1 YSIRK-type signal peptide-containing protein [Staphylococcus simulans]
MKKKQLFSLRKLTVGIASVSLGTVVFLSGAQAVDA